MNGIKLKTRKHFIWKQEWYSVCSTHQKYQEDCDLCNHGRWVNVWLHKLSSLVYKISPKFWIWWVNWRRDPNKSLWSHIDE